MRRVEERKNGTSKAALMSSVEVHGEDQVSRNGGDLAMLDGRGSQQELHYASGQLPAMRSLLSRLVCGETQAALSFAGQGYYDLDHVASLMGDFRVVRELLEAASSHLQGLVCTPEARWSGCYADGFDLISWLQDKSTRPSAHILRGGCYSQPLILIQQVVLYCALYEEGLREAFSNDAIPVIFGHSQGLQTALLIAESPEGEVQTERFLQYVEYAFWQGLAMEQGYTITPEMSAEGASPMAAISGPSLAALEQVLKQFNKALPEQAQVDISLYNTRNRHVVSGHPAVLATLRKAMDGQAEKEAARKKAGRFGGQPLQFTWEYLEVSGPFHSRYMRRGYERMCEKVQEMGFDFSQSQFHMDVLCGHTGKVFTQQEDLLGELLKNQFLRSVRWSRMLRSLSAYPSIEEVLDLGPGEGVMRLTFSALRGTGLQVRSLYTQSGQDAFFLEAPDTPKPVDYRSFAPRLVKDTKGDLRVENRYTRATGHAPVILPGMTPTTVDVGIVAAAANKGFTAELAGGGQVNESIFWLRMEELQQALEPGREVVFNGLYLDPYLWDLHVRKAGLVQKARKAGYPLCGVTISAGMPDVQEAAALLDEFAGLGLWLNAFKPGTLAQIKHVVKIAEAAPHHTIFVHLEGGKAGGHHSWEDLEQLLLEGYHLLRAQPNLVLCVGGGIGTEAQANALLSGRWSEIHDLPIMPVDAVLLGTLTMACKEATTSPQVKQALVDARGCDAWVFAGQVEGAMTSGKSALNADIHYVDNAASRCGRLLDQVAGNAEAVEARRDEIIQALNATAKPYFGDLAEMTYQQVVQRMIDLMARGRFGRYEDGPWLDVTHRTRFADFLCLAEARLCDKEEGSFPCFFGELKALDNPQACAEQLLARYPQAATQRLHPADIRRFIHSICARPGKPVPFIPVVDADVRRWYKADSLWQAHDERYSAEQVLIIPGPAALQGLTSADEPVASMLGRFVQSLADELKEAPKPQIIETAALSLSQWPEGCTGSVELLNTSNESPRQHKVTLTVTEPLTSDRLGWFGFLHDAFTGPVIEAISSLRLYTHEGSQPNPIRDLCHFEQGAEMQLILTEGRRVQSLTYRPHAPMREESVQLRWQQGEEYDATLQLEVEIAAPFEQESPHTYSLPLQVKDGILLVDARVQSDALRDFYQHVLFGRLLEAVEPFAPAQQTITVDAQKLRGYAVSTGSHGSPSHLPLNMTFSMVWEPLFRLLSADGLCEGLLRLVHLSHQVELGEGWPISAQEPIQVEAQLTRLEDSDNGRSVHTLCTLSRGEKVCARVHSAFFIRGYFGRTSLVLQAKEPFEATFEIQDAPSLDFLLGHAWITFQETPAVGEKLTLRANLEEQRPRQGTPSFSAKGGVFRDGQKIAEIALQATHAWKLHPVRALLQTLEQKAEIKRKAVTPKTLAKTTAQAPQSMETFAEVSGDLNPIHRSVLFARMGQLDQPIVHGMWTAARLHSFLVATVAEGEESRISAYKASFLAPLLLGETLQLEATRTAVEEGVLHIDLKASALREEQAVAVVQASAKVKMPRTVYMFPGQGIQQKGMGMEGYSRSKAARGVWDMADSYTREKLGFSILEIVRNNPKELLVQGHTHIHPQGVLHLTQFTQVAMAVLAQAQVAELREAGLLLPDAIICGHSVGEYNAIGVTGILPLTDVVEIVYHRGLVMHSLVPRDEAGESGYRMGVLRPHYAGMSHAQAEALVQEITKETGLFLQIVNYNVRGRQYSVTGQIGALERLQQRLQERSAGKKAPYLEVPGIDVPFHSSVLFNGVDDFRETLNKRFPQSFDVQQLLGRYIPNLVPKPFSLEHAYIEEVYQTTNSPILRDVLADFDSFAAQPQRLARLLLIELLAWQFASPVRWIETQELLFQRRALGGLEAKRVVEIGVGYQPTLANMARYSHQLLGPGAPPIEILNVEAEADRVFLRDEDQPVAVETEAPKAAQATQAAPAAQAPVAAAPVASVGAPPPTDQPISVEEGVIFVLAAQARVRPEQLSMQETLDDLFDGVSSRRNQVLLDLGAEFQMGPIDGAHEKPLRDLIVEVSRRCPSYKAPGKYMRATQDDAIKRVLGRAGMGRKDVESYFEQSFGLGAGLREAALCALALESREGTSARGGVLGALGTQAPADRNAAKTFLDEVTAKMGQAKGLTLSKQGQGGQAGGAAVDAAVVRELEDRILGAKGVLMQSARSLATQLGQPLAVEGQELSTPQTTEQDKLAIYEAEHDSEFSEWIQPRFEAKKHVAFSSPWATARRDLAALFFDLRNGRCNEEEALQEVARLACFHEDITIAQTASWYAKLSEEQGDHRLAGWFSQIAAGDPPKLPMLQPSRPHLALQKDGNWSYTEQTVESAHALDEFIQSLWPAGQPPFVQIGDAGAWNQDFAKLLQKHTQQAFAVRGCTALVTGASPGSIALACVRYLLRGGARVIVTTSTYNSKRIQEYRDLYEKNAIPGAELHVVPFNQASFQDIESLIQWLFSSVTEQDGAKVRVVKRPFAPDLVLPFAAIKDLATLDSLTARSNAVMRAMLLSVERLVTGIAGHYKRQGLPAMPCHVVLPLSPNHGGFGGDGVYAETKAALEAMLAKWESEFDAWGKATTLCAARIGWVRGTGLMDANNLVASHLEERTGMRTFSSDEMGWLLTALCTTEARKQALQMPLEADLTGGFRRVKALRQTVSDIRAELEQQATRAKQHITLQDTESELLGKPKGAALQVHALPTWPAGLTREDQDHQVQWPKRDIPLQEMVVLVGMGEIGPCGSSRTRYELEVGQELSAAAVLELAWMTGLLRYEEDGKAGVWKDTESNETVEEHAIARRYRDKVRERVGLRWVEQETVGIDPNALPIYTSIFLEQDFTFSVASEEEARTFVAMAPEKTRAHFDAQEGQWRITRMAGTEVKIPRQVRLQRQVMGQVPQGFDFARMGLSSDMVERIDRVALFNLIATVDAFLSAGIEPEELMRWLHPARVANTQGSGIGGMRSLARLYRDHVLDLERQPDILQETLINVAAAYVVQSYVGSYGPMSHPVAACATAAVSLEEGLDKIFAGKADFVVAGGYDDVGRESLVGFGDMNATANTDEMTAMGLEPAQMSRANDTRRRGFVEAQGGGTFLLARADVALQMGLPIYGVVGYSGSFGDGIHKSIPAPGMGALACAMGGSASPLAQSLQRFGLTADDIGVVYKHDTSTAANDPNENELHHRIQRALGRSEGNPLFVVSQKALTGHSKGGAAAWQLIGLCQTLQEGRIAGNPNLDNVDPAMRSFAHMAFTNKTLQVGPANALRAGLLTSLGFGHVSGIALILHPDAFLAQLTKEQQLDYTERCKQRIEQSQQRWAAILMGQEALFTRRSQRRFEANDGSHEQACQEAAMLLNPQARLDPNRGIFTKERRA
ncbi:MAG: DUF1729 domain-containing protein [Myxococcales bacterium]|nr:DUF1729 domain-containing protein [Myxococcales bacterium]